MRGGGFPPPAPFVSCSVCVTDDLEGVVFLRDIKSPSIGLLYATVKLGGDDTSELDSLESLAGGISCLTSLTLSK